LFEKAKGAIDDLGVQEVLDAAQVALHEVTRLTLCYNASQREYERLYSAYRALRLQAELHGLPVPPKASEWEQEVDFEHVEPRRQADQ